MGCKKDIFVYLYICFMSANFKPVRYFFYLKRLICPRHIDVDIRQICENN